MACRSRQPHAVQLLLERGASVHAKANSAVTPLHVAAMAACSACLQLASGAKVDMLTGAGPHMLTSMGIETTPAEWSSESDDVVELLLAAGLAVNKPGQLGFTARQVAALYYHLPLVRVLLRNHASHGKADGNMTGLHCSFGHNRVEGEDDVIIPKASCLPVVQVLLEGGADANAQSSTHGEEEDGTPLHLACGKGDTAAARLLLKHGASAKACTKLGSTHLQCLAAVGTADDEVKLLVEELVAAAPACLHSKDQQGQTPLKCAVLSMNLDAAAALLQLGGRSTSKHGMTLHLLCMQLAFAATA